MPLSSISEARPTGMAFRWLLFLGPFFFSIYGATNWITSQQLNVSSYYFEWERWIPFVPIMIIPYMSTDAMFAGSLFLCRTKPELHRLAYRFILAISLSALCFLVFPLRFAFPRPPVEGFLGSIFGVLTSFDQPYNQAPSLHISLLILQWMIYARHTRGRLHAAIHIWCVLIGLSTIFTYQHHVIDLYSGVVVAMIAYYAFPDHGMERTSFTQLTTVVSRPSIIRHRLVAFYATGSLVCLGVGWFYWHPMHLLLWPAAALALIAVGYGGAGTAIFLKFEGRLSLCSRIALAPYLLGAYLSYRLHVRTVPPHAEIVPGLWLGRRLSNQEAAQAITAGVAAVLDLTAEFNEASPFLRLPYCNLQTMDLTPLPSRELNRAVSFIQTHIRDGTVFVHCALGYARSAETVIAYLMATGQASNVAEAEAIVRQARPKIVLSKHAKDRLNAYQHGLLLPSKERLLAS